jgi:hypothetical protein
MLGFLQLPSTVPWWLLLAALIPVGLYVLLFLAMPFSVFGVKSRLEAIEARLDDMHADIRGVALQLAEHKTRDEMGDGMAGSGPPILPARDMARGRGEVEAPRRGPAAPRPRSEPKLDWPR